MRPPRAVGDVSKQSNDSCTGIYGASGSVLRRTLRDMATTESVFMIHRVVTTVTSVPGLSLTPYKTYPLLTYINLLVTVVTVVTMPVPQWFLVSPVIDGHQFQSGDV